MKYLQQMMSSKHKRINADIGSKLLPGGEQSETFLLD